MPAPDLTAAQAQIDANAQLQAYLKSLRGSRAGAGATDPTRFGIQAPPGYVISNATGKLVDNWSLSDKLMTGVALGGMTAGLAGVGGFGGIGGGGGSAPTAASLTSSAIPESAVPGSLGLLDGGVLPLGTGLTAGQMTTPALGAMTATAAGAAPSVASKLASAFKDPSNLASLASIIPALAAASGGGGGGYGGGATMPQLDELIGMASDRAKRTDPLHQMVTRLAESRMPITAKG